MKGSGAAAFRLPKYSKLERRHFPKIYLFLLPTLILFVMFYLYPILQVVVTAFTKWDGYNAPQFDIGHIFVNYERLFAMRGFLPSLKNLFWWSLIAMTLHVGIGALVAFLLADKLAGWKFVRAVYMIPNVISAAAWAMIYRFLFNQDFGLLNGIIKKFNQNFNVNWFYESPAAFWAITFTWLFYAVIVTLIVLADLMAIPRDLHEAAEIDGAMGWQRTLHIDLPLCRNSIGTGVILSVTSRIAMYENIALTTRGGPGTDTNSLALLLVKATTDYNYGLANAVALLMFIFGILVMLIINRVFRMNDPVY